MKARIILLTVLIGSVLMIPAAALAQTDGDDDAGVLFRVGGDAFLEAGESTDLMVVVGGAFAMYSQHRREMATEEIRAIEAGAKTAVGNLNSGIRQIEGIQAHLAAAEADLGKIQASRIEDFENEVAELTEANERLSRERDALTAQLDALQQKLAEK
jgi:septal ring factor EnvC (AmiA/AmiB activator)